MFFIITGLPLLIVAAVRFFAVNSWRLGFTNKRVTGKTGIIRTSQLDVPLNQVSAVTLEKTIVGGILGYGTVGVSSSAGNITFKFVINAESFRSKLMEQLDIFDQERVRRQAEEMADAMNRKNNS